MNVIQYPKREDWDGLLKRPVMNVDTLRETVRRVLDDVKARGDRAVKDYERQFDHVELECLAVTEEEMEEVDRRLREKRREEARQEEARQPVGPEPQEKPAAPETALDARLRRIQAKLFAYLEPPEQVIRRYPLNDNSLAAGIAHAVYYMRKRNLPRALEYADKLIKAEPDNPYFWEIKGQALFEGGKPAEAAAAYRRMLELKPESEQFKLAYAEAVIATGAPHSELQKLMDLVQGKSDISMP